MRVLLDTCAISEYRKPVINNKLNQLIDVINTKDLFISVITIGELTKGLFKLEEGKNRKELLLWIQSLESKFNERILSVDLEIARIWGEVVARTSKMGKVVPVVDGLIAATAIRHGLHLITRDDDFLATGVMILNPWKD